VISKLDTQAQTPQRNFLEKTQHMKPLLYEC
jgi:hypothetical protein